MNNTITSFHTFTPMGSGECQNKVPARESDGDASESGVLGFLRDVRTRNPSVDPSLRRNPLTIPQ